MNSDAWVTKYVTDARSELEIYEAFESRLPEWSSHSNHWLSLIVETKESRVPVAITGFVVDQLNSQAEVGFLFNAHASGNGYATESLRTVIECANQLSTILSLVAYVTSGNAASCRVLEKCGFNFASTIPNNIVLNGQLHDDFEYRLSLRDT